MSSAEDLLSLISDTKRSDLIVAPVVEACLCAHLPSLTDTRGVLIAARKRLLKIKGLVGGGSSSGTISTRIGSDMRARLSRCLALADDALQRLKTFNLMFILRPITRTSSQGKMTEAKKASDAFSKTRAANAFSDTVAQATHTNTKNAFSDTPHGNAFYVGTPLHSHAIPKNPGISPKGSHCPGPRTLPRCVCGLI